MLLNLFFKKICSFILFFFLCVYSNAEAKDFGVFGNTFEIQEQDLLEYIQTKLKEINIDEWQKNFKEQSIKSINRPTPTMLPYATTNKIYFFDPSIILTRDYKDNKGEVFAKKGTKINPLQQISLTKNLIFIDGDNKQQVDYAINYYNNHNGKVKIILVNGAIIDLMKEKNIKFYFDQQGLLIKKFNINYLPAVVSQEKQLLKIEEVVLNYD